MKFGINVTSSVVEARVNVTLNETVHEEQRSQLISDGAMFYLNIYFYCLLCGCLSFFGVVNNIVNMIIFYKLGLNDSMGVGLMVLSLTDFLVSLFTLLGTSFSVWDMVVPNSYANPMAIQFMLGWWKDALFLCSAWVTTFLTVERFVCVVFPFRVRDIFTKFRSTVVLVIIYVVNIGAHMPVYLTQWLEWTKVKVETPNGPVFKDRLVLKFSDNRHHIQLYIDIVNGAVLPIPSQVLVLVSVMWMIYGLKVSSRIRSVKGELKNNLKEDNLSSKERRLVNVVLLLAMILTLCNIPRFMAVYAKQVFPQITFNQAYTNLYSMMWNFVAFAAVVNSSVNIFVYLTVNVKYRHNFKTLLCKE